MSPAPTGYYLEVDDTCIEVPDYPLRAIETLHPSQHQSSRTVLTNDQV